MEPLKETVEQDEMEQLQDAWQAYKCFRAARSLFFLLIFLGLILIQGGFWAIDLGWAGTPEEIENQGVSGLWILGLQEQEPPAPAPEEEKEQAPYPRERVRKLVELVVDIFYYVLPFSVVIYCLTLLIGLKLALVGRLGGLADSSRAFFLSLVVLVLVVPWYETIDAALPGALFGSPELIDKYCYFHEKMAGLGWWGYFLYYGRFVGLWILAFLLLLAAQLRSHQAARKIQRRFLIGQQGTPSSIVAAAAEARRDKTLEELGEKLAELSEDQEEP
ncbi:MAG: hypothetical protein AMJ79_14855 [Phycisphaerae bacterium SM23_30]|nr:MAG: hypothetical protein AMJ79_14855 [Phycisphaerae bacterium SM23_30]